MNEPLIIIIIVVQLFKLRNHEINAGLLEMLELRSPKCTCIQTCKKTTSEKFS